MPRVGELPSLTLARSVFFRQMTVCVQILRIDSVCPELRGVCPELRGVCPGFAVW